MCWLPGGYSPTVCVHLFYRYSQRPLLMGWNLKKDTATPNHEHGNRRQQLIHVFKICPFQGVFSCFFSMQHLQSFLCIQSKGFQDGSYTSRPHNGVRPFERTRTNVHIWIFIAKTHVSLTGGKEVAMCLHIAVAKLAGWRRGLGSEIKTTHLWILISFPGYLHFI